MKKNVLAALMVAAMLIGLVGHAQDTAKIGTSNSVSIAGAHLGVGVGYRNFHTVRLKGASQNSFVGIWTSNSSGMSAYNSESVHNIVSGNATNVGTYMPASANITVSNGYNLGGHGSWGNMESMAPIVSLDADIYQNDSWTLSVISNLQYYNMDTASSAKGGSIGETTYHTKVYWTDRDNWGEIRRASSDPDYRVSSSSYLTGTGRTKFDLQMLEIDLGLKLGYTLASGLDFYVAAGPSLSYADMESSSGGRHDNDLDYIFGLYAAIGSSYWFNESYGLSFDIRYDEAFKHADTKYANLNLDSWSAILKFLVQF
ncbi:MAG: hypothetical protein IJU61_08455 [Victivallales bacterium]|jgi:hypothetical protein|nr:hypothetical protein [Victivallales bacterium]